MKASGAFSRRLHREIVTGLIGSRPDSSLQRSADVSMILEGPGEGADHYETGNNNKQMLAFRKQSGVCDECSSSEPPQERRMSKE
jgi:hypothetical protein